MVDALDEDEWWLEPINHGSQVSVGKTSDSASGLNKEKGKKRRYESENPEENKVNEMKEIIASKKKKKRHKKRNDPSTKKKVLSSETLLTFFRNETKKTLSPLELEEVLPLDDSWFLGDIEHDANLEQFAPFLKRVIPKWEKLRDKLKTNHYGSPVLIVLTISARRAVELNRASISFKGPTCKTAKLFAKHLKLEDQQSHLTKNMVQFGIGTPNRVLKLLQRESLRLKKTKFVIIDWSYKDVKNRGIMDMPGVKQDLLQLLQLYLFPNIRAGKLKIGLF